MLSMFSKLGLGSVRQDLLSGLTVSLALVPEAIAFAFVAGLEPLVGLYAAFSVGLIAAAFGQPGMISGATGAMAVVIVALVAQHGPEYLFAAVVLAGLLQVLAGLLKLGKFIRIVPHPVMLGFVNGLAIVIFMAQFGQFKEAGPDGGLQWIQGETLYTMLGLLGLTMAVVWLLPKWTKAVPASLAAILLTSAVSLGFGLETRTVGDVASISGSLPSFALPAVPWEWETLSIVFPYAVVLAAVGLIESLLTLSLIGEITQTKGRPNQECFAQGAANVVTGFLGGMGGCAMIGQSMINITSGGRGRLSGIVAALALLSFILFASPLIERIPVAALTGVMFMVVIATFEWSSLRILNKIPKQDAFVIVLVSAVTVFTDLAVAVLVGVVVSALHFSWTHAKHLEVEKQETGGEVEAIASKTYALKGSLFFGSTSEFLESFDTAGDPDQVYLDLKHSKVCDHSGIEALQTLSERYQKFGKSLTMLNANEDCKRIMDKAGKRFEYA